METPDSGFAYFFPGKMEFGSLGLGITNTKLGTGNMSRNKGLQVAFTHVRVHMGASVYSPGPEEN